MSFLNKYKRYIILSFFILIIPFSFLSIKNTFAETEEEKKIRLLKDLADLDKLMLEQQKIISSTEKEKNTLSKEIKLLQAQIDEKKLEIKKIDGNISLLNSQIVNKNIELNDLSNTLDKQKIALSNALRNMYFFDGTNNFINLLLDKKTISEFFTEADKIVAFQSSVSEDVNKIKLTSNEVNKVKSSLEDNKDSQIALKNEQKAVQTKIDNNKAKKNTLLKETQGKEEEYKKELVKMQKKAADIRAALFSFAGGETKAIPFGDALKYAEQAENQTGVPAALVLAILTQESALGANVGKCYLSDLESGAGYNINTKTQYNNVMKPTRDLEPFIAITKRLGLDPLTTVVSCPIPSAGGYGGAMGPAQFIASTWLSVESRAGVSNPWNARDAITASSYYLSQLGATNSYSSQVKAACKYYGTGGSSCSYGTQVMNRVAGIQDKIDYLKQYGE